MSYIDGFVMAVPTANRAAYVEFAKNQSAIFKEHGALKVTECWGDDVPEGKLTSFTLAVKREPEESVVFSWVHWPSKAARDAAWAKLMQDPRMAGATMPLDGKRIIYGGFDVIIDA
jgi:uncharacterized protein YbaA (DUF1428 family)